MREDALVNAELHQRTEDMCHALWDIVESRQTESQTELSEVSKSGWLDSQQEMVCSQVQSLLIAEFYRYLTSTQVIADYYSTLDQKKLTKAEFPSLELTAEVDSVDKMCEKVINFPPYVPQLEEEKEKDPKAKKKDVKGAKKGEEEKVEKSAYQEKMEEVMKNEHNLLVYRAKRLQDWGKRRAGEMTDTASKVFSGMNNWILKACKAENLAILELSKIIREKIESQDKIRPLLSLDDFDAVIHAYRFTYEIIPPAPLEPKESKWDSKLSVPVLQYLYKELCDKSDVLSKNVLASVLNNTKKVNRALEWADGFNDQWGSLDLSDFYRLLNVFDPKATGLVSWREVLNSLVLCESSPAQDIQGLASQLQEEFSCEEWVSTKTWFDQGEQNVDEDGALPYDRLYHIKYLLFMINSKDGVMKKSELVSMLEKLKPLKGLF